jgi:hypothetical protein
MITGGRNMGRVGVVTHRERHDGGFNIVHLKDAVDNEFATREGNVFIIGEEKPWISLPKGKGVKVSSVLTRRHLPISSIKWSLTRIYFSCPLLKSVIADEQQFLLDGKCDEMSGDEKSRDLRHRSRCASIGVARPEKSKPSSIAFEFYMLGRPITMN